MLPRENSSWIDGEREQGSTKSSIGGRFSVSALQSLKKFRFPKRVAGRGDTSRVDVGLHPEKIGLKNGESVTEEAAPGPQSGPSRPCYSHAGLFQKATGRVPKKRCAARRFGQKRPEVDKTLLMKKTISAAATDER